MNTKFVISILVGLCISVPASGANSRFGLGYNVERFEASRFSIDRCLATVEAASGSLGFVAAARKVHPGELAVFASGPRNGGGSLTVYCMAVGDKTASIVQVLDYSQRDSAAAQRTAETVHRALLRAANK